jgi:hypothetical protein
MMTCDKNPSCDGVNQESASGRSGFNGSARRALFRFMLAGLFGAAFWSTQTLAAGAAAPGGEGDRATVIVIAGAPGEAEFEPDFKLQIDAWEKVSRQAEAKYIVIGDAPLEGKNDRDRVKAVFEAETKAGRGELWIVLIGHGTFDGREAKMNLHGPDVSAAELSEWLKPFQRPMAVINTTSSSAPFMAKLSAPQRVIVTSTRSGFQQNYARFGRFLAEALADPKSDLDKDGQISLLESFLSASHRTAEFYKT